MKTGRNLVAGLINSSWTAVVNLAVVPIYIGYLGIEAYGLIGFYAILQSVLVFLDLGLAPTINREVARCSVNGELSKAGNLLHSLAIIYWLVAALIALLLALLSPAISNFWITSNTLSTEQVTQSVMLMGVVIACRWPVGLYQGAIMGAQRLVISSSISMVMVTLSSIGTVLILAYFSATIEAYFRWQALIGLCYALWMRAAAWRVIGSRDKKFDLEALRRIWRFSIGMSGVAVSTIVLVQLDKILLSKILSLEDFGYYALSAIVASGLYIILTPVFNLVYPRFSSLIAAEDMSTLLRQYSTGTKILSAILFPISLMVAFYSYDFISLWTGDIELAAKTSPITSILVVGTALNGVMLFPYALQLANGESKLPLTISLLLIIGLVPTTILLAMSFGAIGGALAWLSLNITYLLLGTFLTHRRFLIGIAGVWLIRDVGFALVLSIILSWLGKELVVSLDLNQVQNLACGLLVGIISIFAIALLSFRLLLLKFLNKIYASLKLLIGRVCTVV